MTHNHAGKYSAKHPGGSVCRPEIAAVIKKHANNGRITCVAAHVLATAFRVQPAEIGKAIDLMEYRIIRCQLGLFGYSPEKNIVTAAKDVPEDLRNELLRTAGGGRISCTVCWDIAQRRTMDKMIVASACEAISLQIHPCQLGAF